MDFLENEVQLVALVLLVFVEKLVVLELMGLLEVQVQKEHQVTRDLRDSLGCLGEGVLLDLLDIRVEEATLVYLALKVQLESKEREVLKVSVVPKDHLVKQEVQGIPDLQGLLVSLDQLE